MRVVLVPMEGVLDALVLELLCEINDYDLCITEFLRVVDGLLPEKSFYRLCPELRRDSRTPDGTPVQVQLLGQSPPWLAENAWRAAALGSWGVDLNCGCPSKTVNGSGGGATLLKDPELIYQAAKAIRAAVPADQPAGLGQSPPRLGLLQPQPGNRRCGGAGRRQRNRGTRPYQSGWLPGRKHRLACHRGDAPAFTHPRYR